MSKPREWTVYVKLGRVLGEPRMDAEAVKVREVTSADEAKDEQAKALLESINEHANNDEDICGECLLNVEGWVEQYGTPEGNADES